MKYSIAVDAASMSASRFSGLCGIDELPLSFDFTQEVKGSSLRRP